MRTHPSPYANLPESKWESKTQQLIDKHPLKIKELMDIVNYSWNSIFKSRLGNGHKIGLDIFPKPQIMGFLLHELIALELIDKHPRTWKGDDTGYDKDLTNIKNENFP